MTLAEACAELRAQGCTNVWRLTIWEPAKVQTITDSWIARADAAQQKANPGEWSIAPGNRYIYFTPNSEPNARYRVFYGA